MKDALTRHLIKNHLKFCLSILFLALIIFIFPPIAEAANSRPQVISINPSDGNSEPDEEIIFTTIYKDPDGWEDLQYVRLLINTQLSSANGFYAYYRRDQNKIYMYKYGAGWLQAEPGSQVILENDYVKLDCSKTTVLGEGDTLTIVWAITFKQAFAGGRCYLYMYAYDMAYARSGWQSKGTWQIGGAPANSPPYIGGVNPSYGNSKPGEEVFFSTTYKDPDGWDDLMDVLFHINKKVDYKEGFYGYYRRDRNKLYLYKDGRGWLGGVEPGSQNILKSDYAILDCSKTTVSAQGDTLTIRWAITFKEKMSATYNQLYLYATDMEYERTGWVRKGSWRVNQPPSIEAVEPSNGSSKYDEEVLFTTTYKDPDGWDNLLYSLFLINTRISSREGFYGYYRPSSNKLYLYKYGTGWLGGVEPGSPNMLENDYVKLDCSKTTISGKEDTLTITWAITFKEAFAGKSYNMYMYTMDRGYARTGWQNKGTWEVLRDINTIKHIIGHGTFGNVNHGWLTQGIFWQSKIKIKDIDNDKKEEIVLGNNQGYVHVLEYENNNYIDAWKSECLGWLVSSLATDDVDSDGEVEIIATEYRVNQCEIFFFDGKTKVQEDMIPLAFIFSVHTDDLDGDLTPEIIAGTRTGDIHIYDGKTKTEKAVIEGSGVVHALNSTDLNGDNKKEIIAAIDPQLIQNIISVNNQLQKQLPDSITPQQIQNTILQLNQRRLTPQRIADQIQQQFGVRIDNTFLFIFDGETRREITNFENPNPYVLCTVEIEDIDKDGIKEIVTSDTGGYIYAFEFDAKTQSLKKEWTSLQLAGPIYSIKLNDLDDDSNIEIIAGAGKKIYIFDGITKASEWESNDFISGIFDLDIGDPDYDGDKEIFLGLDVGYLYVIDGKNKNVEWQDIGGQFYALEVADIDSDSTLEYILGDEVGFVYIFDGGTNKLEWQSNRFEARITGLATHDVDEDNSMEFMLSSATGIYIYNGQTKQQELKIDVDDPWGLVADDLDKDGHIEVATYSKGDRYWYGFSGKEGRLKLKSSYLEDCAGVFLKSGDFDDDGQIEVAMPMGGRFGLFDAKGGSDEWYSKNLGWGGVRGIVLGDIDGDNVTEFVAQPHCQNFRHPENTGGPVIFEGKTKKEEYVLNLAFNYGLAIGDVDEDPSLEIVSTCGYADWVRFYFIDGETKEKEYYSEYLGEFIGHRDAIKVVDIDSDGKNEIVAGSEGYIIIFATAGNSPRGGDVSCPLVYIGIGDDTVISDTVNINIQASDNTAVSKLELYIDGVLKHELTQSSYQWSLNTKEYSDGQHIIKAIAYDLAGNIGFEEVRIGIDNYQPDPPAASGVFSPTYINPLAIGGTRPAYTSIWINGEEIIPFNNNQTWLAFVDLNEGNNSFTITAKSYSGRVSVPLILNIFLDTTPPQTPIISVNGTTDYLDRLSASWSSQDRETGIVEYQYAIGTQSGSRDILDWTSAGPATEVTAVDLSLINGQTYYFSVKAKNGAGNWSESGISDGISAQHQPPQITQFQPSKFEWFVVGDTVNISFSTNPVGLEYRISIDGQIKSDWSANTSYSWITQDADFGRHTIKVEAKDDKGGHSEENIPIFVRHQVMDLPEHR